MIRITVVLDDIIDPARVLYRIWWVLHDDIRALTCRVDMHIPKAKKCLDDACSMWCHFLDTIEVALGDCTREYRDLLYTDDTGVRDDDDIELIIDPVEEDKCEEHDPIDWNPSPVERTSYDIYHDGLIWEKYPCTYEECYEVEKVKYQDDPVSMKRQEYLLIVF